MDKTNEAKLIHLFEVAKLWANPNNISYADAEERVSHSFGEYLRRYGLSGKFVFEDAYSGDDKLGLEFNEDLFIEVHKYNYKGKPKYSFDIQTSGSDMSKDELIDRVREIFIPLANENNPETGKLTVEQFAKVNNTPDKGVRR